MNLIDESGEIRATGFTDVVDKFYNMIEVNKVGEGHVDIDLGPVVQSIVSLTSSLRGQLVKCFSTL